MNSTRNGKFMREYLVFVIAKNDCRRSWEDTVNGQICNCTRWETARYVVGTAVASSLGTRCSDDDERSR
jgi:hypothetical protein